MNHFIFCAKTVEWKDSQAAGLTPLTYFTVSLLHLKLVRIVIMLHAITLQDNHKDF